MPSTLPSVIAIGSAVVGRQEAEPGPPQEVARPGPPPSPLDALRAGDILLLHDGNAARGHGGAPVIAEVLPRLLDTLESRRLTPVTLRAALVS